MSNNNASSGGTGLGTLLLVLFIGLKLTNHIDWSWWWVFSPVWLPLAVLLVIGLPVLLVVRLFRHPR